MKNKENIGILLVALGIITMLISFNDVISILVDVVGKLFKLELPVVFFSSFLFRALITCIGGIICLSGSESGLWGRTSSPRYLTRGHKIQEIIYKNKGKHIHKAKPHF